MQPASVAAPLVGAFIGVVFLGCVWVLSHAGSPPFRMGSRRADKGQGSTFVSYTGTEPSKCSAGPPPIGVAGGAAKSVTISHSASGARSSRGLRLGPTARGIASTGDCGPTRLTGLSRTSSCLSKEFTAFIRRGHLAAPERGREHVDRLDACNSVNGREQEPESGPGSENDPG